MLQEVLAHASVQLPDEAQERLVEDLPILEVGVFLTSPEEHGLWKRDIGNKLSLHGRRNKASWENWIHQELMTHCFTWAWGSPNWLIPPSYSLFLSSDIPTNNTLLVSHTTIQAEALCLLAGIHGSPHLQSSANMAVSSLYPPLSHRLLPLRNPTGATCLLEGGHLLGLVRAICSPMASFSPAGLA